MNEPRKHVVEAIDLQDVDVLEDGIAPVISIDSMRVPTDGGGDPPAPPDTTR